MAKHCRFVNPISTNISLSSFSIVNLDVWCPSPITSLFDFKYFVTFVDDYSRATWVYLLKNKSDVCVAFKSFHNMATRFSTI